MKEHKLVARRLAKSGMPVTDGIESHTFVSSSPTASAVEPSSPHVPPASEWGTPIQPPSDPSPPNGSHVEPSDVESSFQMPPIEVPAQLPSSSSSALPSQRTQAMQAAAQRPTRRTPAPTSTSTPPIVRALRTDKVVAAKHSKGAKDSDRRQLSDRPRAPSKRGPTPANTGLSSRDMVGGSVPPARRPPPEMQNTYKSGVKRPESHRPSKMDSTVNDKKTPLVLARAAAEFSVELAPEDAAAVARALGLRRWPMSGELQRMRIAQERKAMSMRMERERQQALSHARRRAGETGRPP